MKKVFMAVIFSSLTLWGQSSYPYPSDENIAKVSSGWGIKAGMNIANFVAEDEDEEDFTSKKGIVFGFYKTTPISDIVQFQWEVLYTSKGASIEFEEYYYDTDVVLEENGSMDLNFNYLEIPLSFRFLIPAGEGFSPCVYAGGSIGFNTSAVMDYDYEYYYLYDDGYNYFEESGSESGSEKINDSSEIETGLIFGGGFSFPLSSGNLIFDIRYNHGLTSVIDDDDIEIYNRVWSFTVGYGF